jgi:two-component system sensor histidine kinase BaeS
LTLRQATRQVRDSLTASQQQANEVAAAVRGYGQAHATWSGVDQLVGGLSQHTGQRIRLETVGGAVLADSDVIGGRTPRGVVGIPIPIDVRPSLVLPASGNNQTLVRLTLGALTAYQANVAYTTCLTRSGAAGAATNTACTATPVGVAPEDSAAALACADKPEGGAAPCLTDFFANRVASIAPQPVRVYLGAVGESVPEPRAGPTVVAAIAVVLVAMMAALLLSRGVLRPVHELRRAARAVGAGDWSRRVPVSGRDEIAQLA